MAVLTGSPTDAGSLFQSAIGFYSLGRKQLLAVGAYLLCMANSPATCITVSGAGTSSANGTYTFVNSPVTYNGATASQYYVFGVYKIANLPTLDPENPWFLFLMDSTLYNSATLTGMWNQIDDGEDPEPTVAFC